MQKNEPAAYTVKYARGKSHIAGLDEQIQGSGSNYALSACSALSKSVRWCDGPTSDDLSEIIRAAEYYGSGLCAKCRKTAEDLV